MSRKFLITLLTVVFLATPAFTPATTIGLSGSAVAATTVKGGKSNSDERAINLNSSKSNRTKQTGKTKQPATRSSDPLKGLNVSKSKPVN